MSSRQSNAAALRQVTLALRLGAVSHEDAAEILESLISAYELSAAAAEIRERREREEYMRSLPPKRESVRSLNARVEREAEAYLSELFPAMERETVSIEA